MWRAILGTVFVLGACGPKPSPKPEPEPVEATRADGCPATFDQAGNGGLCTMAEEGKSCEYAEGICSCGRPTVCFADMEGTAAVPTSWMCTTRAPACPDEPPPADGACAEPDLSCRYDLSCCYTILACTAGTWHVTEGSCE